MTDVPQTAQLRLTMATRMLPTIPSPPSLDGWIGACPARLADFECEHGRLNGDRTPACGCWPGEKR